jgi:hypothetical protein
MPPDDGSNLARKTPDDAPLRERAPELYQDVLRQYEEGIKLVLQHRIYKIQDDVFEPFRQIAKILFRANATARDAVELHYQTLRKIAPTPESPKAQAYFEVGRTTIIGLMGDLLTYYRDAYQKRTPGEDPVSGDSPNILRNEIENESKGN